MTTKAQLAQIARRRERAVLNAFFEVVDSIRSNARIQEVANALNAGNVERAIDLLQLDRSTYEPLEHEILESFREGGRTGAEQVGRIPMREGELVARFDIRSQAAEAWAASMSSRLVVEIIETQRETLRDVIRQGLADGRNPRSVALDIVGRVNQATGRREGGFIGLTNQQASWVANARRELEQLDENYFNRALRDKRFDASIAKAMREGKAIPADRIDNAITRMQARGEKCRGDVIARTESINALRTGQAQAIDQAIEQSDIADTEAVKEWSATGDARTREDHLFLDGQTVPYDQPFVTADGFRLMYPGDSSLGAPARETIQCRCVSITRINFGARAKRIEGFS